MLANILCTYFFKSKEVKLIGVETTVSFVISIKIEDQLSMAIIIVDISTLVL